MNPCGIAITSLPPCFVPLTAAHNPHRAITGAYVGDLLSRVLAGAKEGQALITVLGHANVVAVASHKNLSCIIVTEGAPVAPVALEAAEREGIPLFSTGLTNYEAASFFAKLP